VAVFEDTTSKVCTYSIAIADSQTDSTVSYQEIVNLAQEENPQRFTRYTFDFQVGNDACSWLFCGKRTQSRQR
jgi:hypothetical protein